MLHRLRPLVLAALCFSSSVSFADAKSHVAAVQSFFKVARMDQLIDATLIQMTDVQIKANPAMLPYRDTLLKFFQKYMSWSSLEPEITKLYVKEFTEAEIGEIAKFYQTPVGQKVMKKLPELSSQGAAIGQARVQEHIGELQAMIASQEAKKAPAAAVTPEAPVTPAAPATSAPPPQK